MSNIKSISSLLLNKFKDAPNHPQQIHISFGATTNEMTVMWSSIEFTKGYVEYMSEPNNLKRVLGKVSNMSSHDGVEALKFIYRAELDKLSPDTTYTYRISMDSLPSKIISDQFKFKTPHNHPNTEHTHMVFADLGLRSPVALHFICHEAINRKYDSVFHIGDIAYDLNTDSGALGDLFMKEMQVFASKIPYLTSPGDHETEEYEGKELYNEYGHR